MTDENFCELCGMELPMETQEDVCSLCGPGLTGHDYRPLNFHNDRLDRTYEPDSISNDFNSEDEDEDGESCEESE